MNWRRVKAPLGETYKWDMSSTYVQNPPYFEGIGWVRVTLPSFRSNEHAVDVVYWCEENCKGKVNRNGSDFLFENGEEAVIFTLRWMG